MLKAISEIKNLKERKNLVPVLYIISLALAFITYFGDFKWGFMPQKIIGVIWIGITLVQLYMDISSKRTCGLSELKWLLKLYFLPQVFLHLYTGFLMVIGKVSWEVFSINSSIYVPCLLAICSLYLFRDRAFRYLCIALVGSWIFTMAFCTITKGFQIFPQAIIQGYINPSYKIPGFRTNYFELHDLVAAAGYIVAFYIFSQKKLDKRDFAFLSVVALIMILGIKRIAVVGLILATLIHLIIRWFPEKKQYNLCIIAGWAGFLFCYFFIYWISVPGAFAEFVKDNGINTMGRVHFYKAIMKHAEFSPFFLGLGRHGSVKIMKEKYPWFGVGQVHSDIIKMYVENGFVVFGLWLWYYLIKVTKQYKKRFGLNAAIFYFGLTVYTFTLYLADTTEVYFICQMFSIITPAAYALSRRRSEESGIRG